MVKKIEVAGADVHSRAELDPLLRHIPRLLDEPAQRIPSGLILRRRREHGFLALGGQRLQFEPVADVSEGSATPRSFRDSEAKKLFNDEFSRKYQGIERVAQRKLTALDEGETLHDLAALPGNHLEALKGDRQGQHS